MTMTARTAGKPPTRTSASVTYDTYVSMFDGLGKWARVTKTYSRVKSTAGNPEKGPNVHHQTEAKSEGNVQQVARRG